MLPPNQFFKAFGGCWNWWSLWECRGSGASDPNQHPNYPLCHAMWAAAIVFDVVAKFCTVATNLLKFCMAGSDGLALALGASGVGRIYTWSVERATGSGLLVAWAVAVGFNSVGNGFKTSSWGSSTIYFPLPSSVIKGRISWKNNITHISADNSIKSAISPWCGRC